MMGDNSDNDIRQRLAICFDWQFGNLFLPASVFGNLQFDT